MGSSTSSFMTGCSDITKYNNAWFVRYNEDTSNITPTHRAVVRIHKEHNQSPPNGCMTAHTKETVRTIQAIQVR